MTGGVLIVAVATLAAACIPIPKGPPEPTEPVPPKGATEAWSIMAPGNGNIHGVTANDRDDQRAMYDNIDDAVAAGVLGDADHSLGRYYKDANFDLKDEDIKRSQAPKEGVEIFWDKFGVPHIYGDTETDAAFGAGFAVAEGRLIIAELARILGRTGLIELAPGGITEIFDVIGSGSPQVTYTEEELQAHIDRTIARVGPDEGRQLLDSLNAFTDGINHWLAGQGFVPQDVQGMWDQLGIPYPGWKPTDVVASAILVGDIFGNGGGGEVCNSHALHALEKITGDPDTAQALYDDLSYSEDPTATHHTDNVFTYPQFDAGDTGTDPAAVAELDLATSAEMCGADDSIASQPSMSNFLTVAGSRTDTGQPVQVGGPQSGYFAPQLLFEMEIHGGDQHASGITFPGVGPWVVIGHNDRSSWTATAGGSDNTDQVVERLCEPGGATPTVESMHYEHDGECKPMTYPEGANTDTVPRTVHGPVTDRGTAVDGTPVAVSRQRLNRGWEAVAAISFRRLNVGAVESADEFAEVMKDTSWSFNWGYADAHDIAFVHSGWYPVRKSGAPFDFPVWGTGEWDWPTNPDGSPVILPVEDRPHELNPAKGYIASWNNRIAPGWTWNDSAWGEGAVHRVDLIDSRVGDATGLTAPDVVSIVQDAGTSDLRGDQVMPYVLRILEGSDAPNSKIEAARGVLTSWVEGGAHRRDRNRDSVYDDAAVPIMDETWEPLVHAVFGATTDGERNAGISDGVLTGLYDDVRPHKLDDKPGPFGSAYQTGWYSNVQRDLRAILGEGPVPAGGIQCGDGDLEACRAELWSALKLGVWRAGTYQLPWNQADPAKWGELTLDERILFIPYVTNFNSMRWVNRPTYQHVTSFRG
ncbi:MAG: penicillin acylase family protein [Acidimicrobiia bacterium]|nr:penicillin acylase family protein [Acidimicrobiia bacterium]